MGSKQSLKPSRAPPIKKWLPLFIKKKTLQPQIKKFPASVNSN